MADIGDRRLAARAVAAPLFTHTRRASGFGLAGRPSRRGLGRAAPSSNRHRLSNLGVLRDSGKRLRAARGPRARHPFTVNSSDRMFALVDARSQTRGRMMADVEVIMLMHSEARYRGVQGFVSRGCDGIARTSIPSGGCNSHWADQFHQHRLSAGSGARFQTLRAVFCSS